MPLFGHHSNDTERIDNAPVAPATERAVDTPPRRTSLFSRARDTSPATTTTTTSSVSPGRRRGLLHRDGDTEDPSIIGARERVMSAEAAERDADKALMAARTAVREAREHVKRLEREAAEEARLAKIKQHHAKSISKRGSLLGRHGID